MILKRVFILLLGTSFLLSCGRGSKNESKITQDLIENPNSAQGKDPSVKLPVITFEKDVHDFGRLTQGESISYSFKFTNTGKADLIITDCRASCGCTVADFPKKVMKPKETGYITVSFNSGGKRGKQHQEVTVVANTQPNTTYLTIHAQVEER